MNFIPMMTKLMETKKRLLIWISLGLIAVLILFQSAKEKPVRYITFQTQTGWGYNILVKNKIVIHQETIPALAVDKGFATQQEASQAAKMVSEKLSSGKIPSLSIKEVQSILEQP